MCRGAFSLPQVSKCSRRRRLKPAATKRKAGTEARPTNKIPNLLIFPNHFARGEVNQLASPSTTEVSTCRSEMVQ